MNIHEYQGKELFRKFGVCVSPGTACSSVDEAVSTAQKLLSAGSSAVVVKSQIHAGGRGKGTFETGFKGGVHVCKSIEEVRANASKMLGQKLVTKQTGSEGRVVHKLLVEVASKITKEFYLAILLDRALSLPIMMVSTEGGMDIEEVAAKTPEKIVKEVIDPSLGMMPYQARILANALGLKGELISQAVKLMLGVYKVFWESDASLVEINPLVIAETSDGKPQLLALDAKINFDDNALFRHPDILAMRDLDEEAPLEVEASKFNLNYIKLDGNIACMVNGAGLAMATMDIIQHFGGSPANFLDVGGGATKDQVKAAFKIILADPNVKGILINIFGGIMKCDVIAEGVLAAVKEVGLKLPLVIRLEGTNVQLGQKMIRESGLAVISAESLTDAAKKIVAAVKGQTVPSNSKDSKRSAVAAV
jgi:succinyl-CoA synthetase beta subunit